MRTVLGAALLLLSSLARAEDDRPFDIRELDKGTSVTLPSPATTIIPNKANARVNPTDKNQVFRIRAADAGCPVTVKVFDGNATEVKLATLKAGESLIYRFNRLNGVRVQTEAPQGCQLAQLTMDSNRPMELGI